MYRYNDTICSAESRRFHAKIDDQLNILCANPKLSLGLIEEDKTGVRVEFEHDIYFTDKKNVYKRRNATSAKLIYNCKVHSSILMCRRFILAKK